MQEFKIGDRVRCVTREGTNYVTLDDASHPFALGDVYLVVAVITALGSRQYIHVKESNENDVGEFADCFEVVQASTHPWPPSESNPLQPYTPQPETVRLIPANPRCECGSTAAGSPAHSRWCPKHE